MNPAIRGERCQVEKSSTITAPGESGGRFDVSDWATLDDDQTASFLAALADENPEMAAFLSDGKDPRLVAGGKASALKRWGPKRRIHIGDLEPARRELVLHFIEAERRAQERERANEAAA